MSKQCACKKGYKSTWDSKCFNCRTKEEQKLHSAKMSELEGYLVTIGNKHHNDSGEYIGRGSPLSNPFTIGSYTREEAVYSYDNWLHDQIERVQDPAVIAEMDRLAHILLDTKRLTLVCYCAPKLCHGNIIRDVLYKALYDHCTPD